MACARASLLWERFRRADVSAGSRCGVDAAAPAATTTIGSADSAARAEPAVGQILAAMSRSCGARWGCRGVPAIDDDGLRVVAHTGMQHQQELAGRPVGAMDGECPASQIGFSANCVAMACNDSLIVIAPGF